MEHSGKTRDNPRHDDESVEGSRERGKDKGFTI